MIGVILISHGKMAEGLADSISLFLGEVEQFDYIGLKADDNPDDFLKQLKEKINTLNTGDGVLIFADLLGGTPSNQSMYLINEKVHVITGMNLTMVLEVLILRSNNQIDINALIETGKKGMVYLNTFMNED